MQLTRWMLTSALMALLIGCGGETVEVIDLSKVLDVMVKTFDDMDAKMGSAFQGNKEDPKVREKYMADFSAKYAENLNNAKLMSKPLGTQVKPDGSIAGFTDPNKNRQYDSGEPQLFSVEIDMERNRLIATDTQNGYRRDHGFSMAGGLVAGMLIGHMLSRQRGAGITGSRFSNMKMNPANYHGGAVNRAKASARARSGSGSFSRGK